MNLTTTLIQTALYWENKAANLQMLEEKIKTIDVPTQVVVLPEMFSTGFSMNPELFAENMDGEAVSWMKRVSAQKRCILTGSLMIKESANYYNRLLWVMPNGNIAWYDKRHRFAFAGENEHYTAGEKRVIASVNGWKINGQVCYDLRFPVWARQTPGNTLKNEVAEYDVLLYVANWPQRRSHAWKSLLIARAIENQCYVIGVNRVGNDGNAIYHSGDSCVIDPMGKVLYSKGDEEAIFTITLDKNYLTEVRQKFPFWKDGDGFVIK